MPNTRVTKQKISTHLHYGKWLYILSAVIAFFVVDMAYTMTEYRPPAERKVDIELVGGYPDTDSYLNTEVSSKMMEAGLAADETLEEVYFYTISYSGDAEQDIYGAQKYMVMIAAQEGDIYVVNRTLMEQLVMQGAATPLDGYIESGALNVEGMDLESVTFDEPAEDEETPPSGNRYVYALPASGLNRMLESDINYDNRDKYIVLMSYSKNPDTSIVALQSMIDQLTAPLPEAFSQSAQTGTNDAAEPVAPAGTSVPTADGESAGAASEG